MRLKIFMVCVFIFTLASFAEAKKSPEWINKLEISQEADQLVIVSGTNGSNAKFSLHEKDSTGKWQEIISCNAYIGKKGWGKTREGDLKTPRGMYSFTMAFGILEDPGCSLGYTQVDDTNYWVGDSNSEMYNRFVSTREYDNFDKAESEHIIDYTLAYKYCLNISYNFEGTPKKGSAIFLHCQTQNKFTGGCVAIPEKNMREVLKRVKSDCVIIMDTEANIKNY